MRRARILAVFLEHGFETVVIVEADQARVIILARQLDTLGPQSLPERIEVERFGFGQRAVEVKENRSNHARAGSTLKRDGRER